MKNSGFSSERSLSISPALIARRSSASASTVAQPEEDQIRDTEATDHQFGGGACGLVAAE
jgi:hypothetical protein